MSDLAMSRRAVTRAIATLPAISIAPVAIAGTDSNGTIKATWDKLMQEYIAAKHISDEYDRLHFDPLYRAEQEKFGKTLYAVAPSSEREAWRKLQNADEIEDQWDAHVEAMANAKYAVLEAPAPDLAALRWKLEETFQEDGTQNWCDEISSVMRADIARLLPMGGKA